MEIKRWINSRSDLWGPWFVVACIIAIILCQGIVHCGWGVCYGKEAKGDPPELANYPYCPKTKIHDNDTCLNCHVKPDFKLKESNPYHTWDLPSGLEIFDEDGITKGYFRLTNISSAYINENLRYLERKNIKHYLIEVDSFGGSLFDCYRIVGLMKTFEARGFTIETRCHSTALSAGFMILISGTKGWRKASTHAHLMWHQLQMTSFGGIATPASSEEQARVLNLLQDYGNDWVARHTGLTKEFIEEKIQNKEFWIKGVEALELNIIDELLN